MSRKIVLKIFSTAKISSKLAVLQHDINNTRIIGNIDNGDL